MPFAGIWLVVPPATLLARVAARRHDPSDATPAVVEAPLAQSRDTIDAADDPDTIACRLALHRDNQDQR